MAEVDVGSDQGASKKNRECSVAGISAAFLAR